MSINISKAIKQKTDAQLRLLEQDSAPVVREAASGDMMISDPNEYMQSLLAGKNITITTAGNAKTINAAMGILAGSNISISTPDENGKVTISGTLKGKEIDISSFVGKNGYVLTYDELSDKFMLLEASGSYDLPQAGEDALGGVKAKNKTTETAEIAIDPDNGKLYGPAPDAATNGIPAGGTTGQILAKIDEKDYNTHWIDPPTGGCTDIGTVGFLEIDKVIITSMDVI